MTGPIGRLRLADLDVGAPAFTSARGGTMHEACLICLTDQGHQSGVQLRVMGAFEEEFIIEWEDVVTAQMRRAWNDAASATRWAANGIALLLAHALWDYTAVDRSRKGSGYLLVPGDSEADATPNTTAWLAVAGLRHANLARVQQRMGHFRIRNVQAAVTYLLTVEFGRPVAWIGKRTSIEYKDESQAATTGGACGS